MTGTIPLDQTWSFNVFRFLLAPAGLLIIGGVLTYWIIPIIQDSYVKKKERAVRKNSLTEEIFQLFPQYIDDIRRLDEYSEQLSTPCTGEESERLAEYAAKRNLTRDGLFAALHRLKLHGSPVERTLFQEFYDFDRDNASKNLKERPKLKEWETWSSKILPEIEKGLSL